MSEYNIGFSEKLIDVARFVHEEGMDPVDPIDAVRTITYLSLLSCEITLKALLEKAGMSVREIKARSHNFEGLLRDICCCDVEEYFGNGSHRYISASRLLALPINTSTGISTVGDLLTGEKQGSSGFPNEIRYGNSFHHFPPEANLQTATEVLKWATVHLESIHINRKRYNGCRSSGCFPSNKRI
jgi:hypothetical protein